MKSIHAEGDGVLAQPRDREPQILLLDRCVFRPFLGLSHSALADQVRIDKLWIPASCDVARISDAERLVAPALHRGRDAHGLAILGDRASRDVHAFLL